MDDEQIFHALHNCFSKSLQHDGSINYDTHREVLHELLSSIVKTTPAMINVRMGAHIKMTVLGWLCSLFDFQSVKFWVDLTGNLKYPIDLDKKDNLENETPLLRSIIAKKREIALFLLENGADPNFGWTRLKFSPALNEAIDNEDHELVSALLAAGADVEGHPQCRYKPIHLAVGLMNHEIIDLLFSYGARISAKEDIAVATDLTTAHPAVMDFTETCPDNPEKEAFLLQFAPAQFTSQENEKNIDSFWGPIEQELNASSDASFNFSPSPKRVRIR